MSSLSTQPYRPTSEYLSRPRSHRMDGILRAFLQSGSFNVDVFRERLGRENPCISRMERQEFVGSLRVFSDSPYNVSEVVDEELNAMIYRALEPYVI